MKTRLSGSMRRYRPSGFAAAPSALARPQPGMSSNPPAAVSDTCRKLRRVKRNVAALTTQLP